ncbi:hypothetical protein [Tolypothrix sp. VBCCA 56010]|uniref:hypothetical protein n=1 Tax=Tolypothrix sp. VBCCA 56010 TaxID=3137731 RepID=UPI003D7DA589
MARSTAIIGLALIVFSQLNKLEICLILIFVIGMSTSLTLASISNFIQLILSNENKRGLTSIFTTTFLGILLFNNLFFGGLASQFGITNALGFKGIGCIIGSDIFYRKLPVMKKIVYPIHLDMGLIPQPNKS